MTMTSYACFGHHNGASAWIKTTVQECCKEMGMGHQYFKYYKLLNKLRYEKGE